MFKQQFISNRCMQPFREKILYATYGCRSLVTVMRKNIKEVNNCLGLKQQSNSIYRFCEVPKLDHVLKAFRVYKTYFMKLKKAGNKLKDTFSLFSMTRMLMKYERISDFQVKKSWIKISLIY